MEKQSAPSLLSRLWTAVKFVAGNQANGYNPTSEPYVPSHLMFPVDGGYYGSSQVSLESIRTAEEFTIALKAIAEAVSALEYKVTDPGKNPIRDTHPLKVLIEQPNPLQDWADFIEVACYHLLPTGDCFILLNPTSMAGTPMAMWLLRPDRTRPIRGDQPTAPIEGYEHYAEDGVRYVFPPEAILHIKLPNPFTPYRGLGITQLIPVTMAMDAASLAFNWMFFKQGGRLSTVIETDKKMSPDEQKEMQGKIQSAYMGYQNAHRAMVLTEGAKLNTTAANASPKEVDFPETRKDISRVSGAILQVPPIRMGHVGSANRSNSVIQDQIFYLGGVSPVAKRFARALTKLGKRFGKFEFEFIIPKVEDPDVLNARATAGSQSGALSPNDIREMWGQEREADPNMDKKFLPFNMQPLDVIATDPELDARNAPATGTATPTGLPIVKPIGEAGAAADPAKPGVQQGGASGDLTVPAKLSVKGDPKPPTGTAIQRKVLKFAVAQRPRTEKRMTKVMRTWINALGAKAADLVQGAGPQERALGMVKKAVEEVTGELQGQVTPIIDGELAQFYDDLAKMFKLPEDQQSFTPGSGVFAAAKGRLAQRIVGVAEAVQSDIEAVVREGMLKGLSAYEIANGTADGSFDGIKEVVDGMAQERAQLIARTETVAMQNQASIGAYSDMGVRELDVIGCQDFVVMPGQTYGCNSQGIPIALAASIEFHPNHDGAIVPRIEKAVHIARVLALA